MSENSESKSEVVRLNKVRISFPDVWEPSQKYNNYSVHGLMEKGDENYKRIMAAVMAVAKRKWPSEGAAIVKQAGARDKLCVHNGELKANLAGYDGMYYISASRKAKDGRPTLFNALREEVTTKEEAAKLFQSGYYANLLVEVWPYKGGDQAPSVFATLLGVQYAGKGERFSGGGRLAKKDEFDDLKLDEGDGDDLTGGLVDDDPAF